jgi:hypothetical protein
MALNAGGAPIRHHTDMEPVRLPEKFVEIAQRQLVWIRNKVGRSIESVSSI